MVRARGNGPRPAPRLVLLILADQSVIGVCPSPSDVHCSKARWYERESVCVCVCVRETGRERVCVCETETEKEMFDYSRH